MPIGTDESDQAAVVSAAVGKIRRDYYFQGLESRLKDFKDTQDYTGDSGETIKLTTVVTGLKPGRSSLDFKLRWDEPLEALQGDTPVTFPVSHHVTVRIRLHEGTGYVFVYADRMTAEASLPAASHALFNLSRQIGRLVPTPAFMDWLLANDARRVQRCGIRVKDDPELTYVTLDGDMDPSKSANMKRYRSGGGEVRMVRYTSIDGKLQYAISPTGYYSLKGSGVTEEDLEDHVLNVVARHL